MALLTGTITTRAMAEHEKERKNNMKEVLHQISTGMINVKWNGWQFAGGRDWGNWHRFTLYKGENVTGNIDFGDNGLTIEVDGKELCADLKDKHLEDHAEKILRRALIRDDKELVDKLPTNAEGNFILPEDYEDITREDILTGRYPEN